MSSKTRSHAAVSSTDPVTVSTGMIPNRSDDARATHLVPTDWPSQTSPTTASRLAARPSSEGCSVRRALPPSHTIKIPPVASGLWRWRSEKPYFALIERATEGRARARRILIPFCGITAGKGLSAAAPASTSRDHGAKAQVVSAGVWRQELESTSSRYHVVLVAACGLWT